MVDAYEGDVTFYAVDPHDPVLRVYQAAFPHLFQPIQAMPAGLVAHLRYPQDLFAIQAQKYATYHMTEPQVFYNSEDLWQNPRAKEGDRQVAVEPYYVLIRMPGEPRLEFLLLTPMTPARRDNMIAWLAARSDPPHYGQLVVFMLPKDRLVLGPVQIEATIDQDTTISRQLTLWDQRGSRVIRGHLLVIPIDEAFLYVEPVYLRAEDYEIPQLQRIIVSDGARAAIGTDAARCARAPLRGAEPVAPGPRAARPYRHRPPRSLRPWDRGCAARIVQAAAGRLIRSPGIRAGARASASSPRRRRLCRATVVEARVPALATLIDEQPGQGLVNTCAKTHRRERHGAGLPVSVRAAHPARRADDQQMSRIEKCDVVPAWRSRAALVTRVISLRSCPLRQ